MTRFTTVYHNKPHDSDEVVIDTTFTTQSEAVDRQKFLNASMPGCKCKIITWSTNQNDHQPKG